MPRETTKVLLVEDNPDDVALLQAMLTPANQYEVIAAGRLEDALDRLREERFDVALVDLGLPDSEGLTTLLRIRSSAPRLPIVVLTDLDDETLAVNAMKNGARDCLVKGQLNPKFLRRGVRYAVERQWLQQGLEQLWRELRASETRLRTIIEKNSDGNLVVDKDGIVQFLNPAAENLLDRKPEELLGKSFGHPVVPGEGAELEIVRKDGEVRVAEMRSVEIDWEGGIAYLASLRDISQLKQLLTETRDMNEQLRKANQIKEDFLANVSHELRTPLATISNILANAVQGVWGGLSPELRDALGTARANVKRQAHIVDNLLDISQIAAGKVSLDRSLVDISALIHSVTKSFQVEARNKGIALTRVADHETAEVFCDPHKVAQILYNLLSNALKFTPSGGTVSTMVRSRDDHVEVTVCDTGIAIPEDSLETIFERFQQLNPHAGGGKGTGLGLAIAKELVELHGGKIWATSESGKGSSFTFTFPRHDMEQIVHETIRAKLEQSRRRESPLSLLVCVVHAADSRGVKERFGIERSQLMLKEVAEEMQRSLLRPCDVLIESANDKIVILLPDTDKRGAQRVKERILSAFRPYERESSFSVGVTSYPDDVEDADGLIQAVDNLSV